MTTIILGKPGVQDHVDDVGISVDLIQIFLMRYIGALACYKKKKVKRNGL